MSEEKNFKTIVTDVHEELIWVSAGKYALFMKHKKTGIDALTLYNHYQFTAILQKTNSIWANDKYCRQGLEWGRDRFEKAKALLLDFGLISTKQIKGKDGKFGKSFIQLKRGKAELEPDDLNRMPQKPQADEPDCGKKTTNALSIKRNALSIKGNALCDNEKITEIIPFDNKTQLHNKIKETFSGGSLKLHGEEYYHDGKEAKAIDNIIRRSKDDNEFLKSKIKLFYSMIESPENDFWSAIKFTPSSMVLHWNRITKKTEIKKQGKTDLSSLAYNLSQRREVKK